MEKNMIEIGAVCKDCKKQFSTEVQAFYNCIPENNSFTVCTCPHCGSEDSVNTPFLFFNQESNVLYTVFSTVNFNSFERINYITNSFLEEYLCKSSFDEQYKIKQAERRYVERELFFETLNRQNSGEFVIGLREIRFTPPPSVSIDKRFCYLGVHKNINLSKNDIAFSSNGLSLFQKNIIDEAVNRLNFSGFTVNLVDVEEERKPSVTCGFIDIALTVGSIIIIPILVNVISDIISDLRHKKEKPLKSNDSISVKIQEDGTKKVYVFEGTPDNVAKAMKECGQLSLQTISLKDCHTAVAIDNLVADLMFPSSFNHQTFNEIAKEYQKVFHPSSAVEVIYKEEHKQKEAETIICYKASLLMNEGDYKAAYWILRPIINEAKTIEFFYNFSLCLSHLNMDTETISKSYEQVIKKYLACPDLIDLSKFDGSVKQSELDKSTQNLVEKGYMVEDEEGIVSVPEPQTEDEIKNATKSHNVIRSLIRKSQEYDLEDLKKEAMLNSLEVQLLYELNEVEKSLESLIEEVKKKAFDSIEKWHSSKDEGTISQNELEQGLLNDGKLPFEIEDDPETDRFSLEFDVLLKKECELKQMIDKVRKNRDDLRAKHIDIFKL